MLNLPIQWLLVLQLVVPNLLVVSRSTIPPGIDIEAILEMSPRTTTIDYDLADFDEQVYGPIYNGGTADAGASTSSGSDVSGNMDIPKTAEGTQMNKNNGKFVMLGPDSNDNVDGPVLIGSVNDGSQVSSKDKTAVEATVETLSPGFDESANSDPDLDGDGISTGDINILTGSGSSKDTSGEVALLDSTDISEVSKQDNGASSADDVAISDQSSSNPTFSSCFKNSSSGSGETDFCRFVNAVYGVCNAHFSSECSAFIDSSSNDPSSISSEDQTKTASGETTDSTESGSLVSEESLDTESAVLSPESTDYDSLRSSLESMGSAEISETTMRDILKIVKGLCPSVCSAASTRDSAESGSTNSESSIESAESSAHSSMTEETSSETSEETVSPEGDTEADSDSSDSSNGAAPHTSDNAGKPKTFDRSNSVHTNKASVLSDSDTETESDSE